MSELPPGVPQPGTIFADKYRVDNVLGSGGMGYVLAATHVRLNKRVAIKMLLPAALTDPQVVERFVREGRAAVNIRSEHVVHIIDVAELPDQNRTPYLVMEYLDGDDLAHVVRKLGKVPFDKAVDWVLEACEAIAEAHAMKIVHRDLKPANLFLARRSEGPDIVKVLDFGISKMDGPEGNLAMTKTSAMLGSPLYMSPEQLKSSRNVDERTDIWAIGVILYELVTGTPPFLAETLAELGALVLGGDTPRLSHVAPDVPVAFSDVIATCLQKRAADRFVNLADFATAIAPFGGPNANESARIITATLGGLPAQRATIAVMRASDPAFAVPSQQPLQRTQVMQDSSGSGSNFALASSVPSQHGYMGPGAPPPHSSPNLHSPPFATHGAQTHASGSSKSAMLIGGIGALFISLAAVGGTMMYKARAASSTPVHDTTHNPPVSSDVPPPAASTPAAITTPTPAADPAPPPSATTSAAKVATTATNRPTPKSSSTTTIVLKPTASAAPAKPPSGIATSSKD